MLDLRTRLLLMIGGAALLVALIIGGILLNKDSGTEEVVETDIPTEEATTPAQEQTAQPAENEAANSPKVVTTPAPVPQTPEEKEALFVRQRSRDFVERFLSYSNKNDNKHLADVEVLVTPTMWEWVKTQTVAVATGNITQETKVATTALISIDSDTANVSINVQQVIKNPEGTKIEYKKGRVELLRLGGTWKVNGLFWE